MVDGSAKRQRSSDSSNDHLSPRQKFRSHNESTDDLGIPTVSNAPDISLVGSYLLADATVSRSKTPLPTSSVGQLDLQLSPGQQAPIFRLNQDVLLRIFHFIDSSVDLSRLALTCTYLATIIRSVQGFSSASLGFPDATTRLDVHGSLLRGRISADIAKHIKTDKADSDQQRIFPPRFTHQGSVQLGNKLYVPFLGVNPVCFVLDLANFNGDSGQWERLSITVPNVMDWKPIAGPVTGVQRDKSYLYFFAPTTFSLDRTEHPVATASPDTYVGEGPNVSPTSSTSSKQSSSSHGQTGSSTSGDAPSYFESFFFNRSIRNSATPRLSFPESTSTGLRPSTGSASPSAGGWKINATETNWLLRLDLETLQIQDLTPQNAKTDLSWPSLLKYHSVDNIQDRWLVIFGGVADSGDGENTAYIYDLEGNRFVRPIFLGIPPRIRYSHATAVIKNRLYIYGGARNESPVHVYDDLSSLAIGETECVWRSYESPSSYHYVASSKAKKQDVEEGDVEMSSPSQSDEEIKTTGTQPRERVGASMIAVNERRLVILGGRTVDDARDPLDSSMTWDEIYAFDISCVDCFDTQLNHFTRTSFLKPTPETFLRDFACSSAFPLVDEGGYGSTKGWGIIIAGFQFRSGDFNTKVSMSSSGIYSNSPPQQFEDAGMLGDAAFEHITMMAPISGEIEEAQRGVLEDVESYGAPMTANRSLTPTSNEEKMSFRTKASVPRAYIIIHSREDGGKICSVDFHVNSTVSPSSSKSKTGGEMDADQQIESSDESHMPLTMQIPVRPYLQMLVLER